MTKSNENRFEVTGGPSREELFDALRLRHEYRPVLFCIFVAAHQRTRSLSSDFYNTNLQINGIAVEDGSGHKWLIELFDPTKTFGSTKLHGYFNTSSRKGWVEPVLE